MWYYDKNGVCAHAVCCYMASLSPFSNPKIGKFVLPVWLAIARQGGVLSVSPTHSLQVGCCSFPGSQGCHQRFMYHDDIGGGGLDPVGQGEMQ